MTDKSVQLKTDSDKCRLVPHRFTDEELTREFPMAVFEYKGLAIWKGDDNIGFLCMEFPPGQTCSLHLWILPEYRTQENILWLRNQFYTKLHPWVKDQGKDLIVVNCHYSLLKTKELFETFGFTPVPIWVGIMPVQT